VIGGLADGVGMDSHLASGGFTERYAM
jgi:hypothetical protein